MECIFKEILPSCCDGKKFEHNILSQIRREKIISSSKERDDSFYTKIEENQNDMHFHTDCYREYTSKEKIKRWIKKVKVPDKESTPPSKRLRRFEIVN